jgi:hypothetical protein
MHACDITPLHILLNAIFILFGWFENIDKLNIILTELYEGKKKKIRKRK